MLNNKYEKISPFVLATRNAVSGNTVQKKGNTVQKEVPNQAFGLVNDQRNSEITNQILIRALDGAKFGYTENLEFAFWAMVEGRV